MQWKLSRHSKDPGRKTGEGLFRLSGDGTGSPRKLCARFVAGVISACGCRCPVRKEAGGIRRCFRYALAWIAVGLSGWSCSVETGNYEEISFRSGQFEIVGLLQTPRHDGPHPAVIIVHGDGRGTRQYYRELRERLLSAGYATLIWDKPGWGGSQGTFGRGRVQSERAAILLAAITILRAHPAVDSHRIGVWGVSQAGYVVSLVLERGAPVGFVMLVGAPGENGVLQTAYFVGQQVFCEGASLAEAAEAESLACGVLTAQRYEEYVAYGRGLLDRYPLVRKIDFMAGILPADRWAAREPGDESYNDPVVAFRRMVLPVLILYGDLDKNVNPEQGAAAFRDAFASVGNDRSRVIVFPRLDHDMVPSETGCMKERNNRRSWSPSPAYLDTLIQWLHKQVPLP